MAYPLSGTSHTGSPLRVVVPPRPPLIRAGNPPTRTTKYSLPPISKVNRSVKTRVVVPPIPRVIRVGLPPNRVWAPLLPFEAFTTISYGQWLPRASRDRP